MPSPAAVLTVYRAAKDAVAWADLSAHGLLCVTGGERVEFVHGMCTNEVTRLAVGASTYAAFLTAKGAMVCDGRILKRTDDLVLETGPGLSPTLRAFLEKYLISEDAELHDAPELALVGLLGPGALALADTLSSQQGRITRRFGGGVDVVVLREKRAEVVASLAAVPALDAATLEVLRVEAGIPRFGADLTETTIPLEANLEGAIAYDKGCYIGQEVIARATYRGHMNRKLTGLLLGALDPASGTELRSGEKKAGWVTSVVASPARGQNVALGYVHKDFLAEGTRLELATGGAATVAALPLGA